jgi:hypothetical protein
MSEQALASREETAVGPVPAPRLRVFRDPFTVLDPNVVRELADPSRKEATTRTKLAGGEAGAIELVLHALCEKLA